MLNTNQHFLIVWFFKKFYLKRNNVLFRYTTRFVRPSTCIPFCDTLESMYFFPSQKEYVFLARSMTRRIWTQHLLTVCVCVVTNISEIRNDAVNG